MALPIHLAEVPVPVTDFIHHLQKHPERPVSETLEPFKAYESVLRKIYAQQPHHSAIKYSAIKYGLTNLVPLFSGSDTKSNPQIRAQNLANETSEESEKYIMPLSDEDRLRDGSYAIVSTLKDFQSNFNLFYEVSLIDMDYSNIVVAGSSVTTALLPVPNVSISVLLLCATIPHLQSMVEKDFNQWIFKLHSIVYFECVDIIIT